MRISIIVACLITLAACGQQPPQTQPTASEPAPISEPQKLLVPTREGHFSADISAADFAAHVKNLASDEYEGRKPGTIGGRMATTYLVDQFQRMGLRAGNNGNFLQTVPMVETTLLDVDKIALQITEGGAVERFNYRADTIFGTLQGKAEVELKDSAIVFAGYGVVAPEYQWNDYAGLDVKGKTVVVLVNDPAWSNGDASLFKGRAMTYYGRWIYKFEEAARQGAAACLIVHDTDAAAYPWDVVVNSWSGPQFNLPSSVDSDPRLLVAGWLTTESAHRLFSKAGADFDALKQSADLRGFVAAPLAAKLSTHFANVIKNTESDNVLALLPGTSRADETIIYSAHWDHLGKDPTIKGDAIFNGAVDNASGLAALLEIADAFAHLPTRPERSILFLAPTLEESVMLGSRFYVAHPVMPLNKTVADINMDVLLPYGRTHDMAIIGYGQSQMDDLLKDALALQQRQIVPDEKPELGFFYRSDQLSFARKGVPVLYARAGFDKRDGGKTAGRAAYDDYTRNRYHKPGDEYDPHWDLSGTVEDIQALYAVGLRLANSADFPEWAADSEFRGARDASIKAAHK